MILTQQSKEYYIQVIHDLRSGPHLLERIAA